MSKQTVLVTGATGFIAQHVVDKLLERGYPVIATGRSEAKNSIVLENFKEKYPNGKLSFSVVSDMSNDNAFDVVLKENPEIKCVIHTASPLSFGIDKPYKEVYLDPAVNGALNILNAIKKYGPQVTKVVMTSSFAALMQQGNELNKVVHTNKLWNPTSWESVDNEFDAYIASKKYAEKAARDFIEKEKPRYSFATVNPVLVLGPQVFDNAVGKTLNASNQILIEVAHTDANDKTPQSAHPFEFIDVRDVAEFHILPLEIDELANEREFISVSPFISQKVLNILNDNFPELKGKIATGDYNSFAKLEEEYCPKSDMSSTINKIPGGYKFITLEKSVVDTFKQYLSKESL